MKNFFTLLLVLVVYSSIGQSKKVRVTYKVDKYINEASELEKIYISTFENYQSIFSEFEFTLDLNDSKSIFYIKDKLFSDKYTAEIALASIEYFGRIEQHKDNFLTENLEEDFGKFLVKRPYQSWTFHENETKMIDNYLCFKATTFYSVKNHKGKEFIHNFTAWYAPQLPYKYGPLGYGNLPGLILELQADGYTFGVSKLEFLETLKLPRLKKLKVITAQELDRLAELANED